MLIGAWIKQYREKNNLTLEEFGKKVGVNKQTVSRWENGSLEPSVDMYYQLSQVFRIPLDEILSRHPKDITDAVPVYRDNLPYDVGINNVFHSIDDFSKLFVFLNMAMDIRRFFKQDRPIGYLVLDNDVTKEEKDVEPIDGIPIIEFSLDNPKELAIHLIVDNEKDRVVFQNERVRKIRPNANFRNVAYVIDLVVEKEDGEGLAQILIDLDDEDELFD